MENTCTSDGCLHPLASLSHLAVCTNFVHWVEGSDGALRCMFVGWFALRRTQNGPHFLLRASAQASLSPRFNAK